MQICFYLIFFLFFCINSYAAQLCKPASIPASTPDSQLTDNGNGTISDIKTGLMWKKCVEGVSGNACDTGTPTRFNWQQALEQPGVINSGAGFAGYHDWRLPNIKELTSIVEEQCCHPAINLTRFPNTTNSSVWSGSPATSYSDSAWLVGFYYGGSYGYSAGSYRDSDQQVRLVRSGQ